MAAHRPLSLALRLTLLFGIATAIVFPIFGWVVVQSTENHFAEEDADELKIIAGAAQELLIDTQVVREHSLLKQRLDDILVGHHDASLYTTGPDGQVMYTSRSVDLSSVAIAPTHADTVRQWDYKDNSYRVLNRSVKKNGIHDNEPFIITVAVPIDHHLRFLASFRRSIWLMTAGSIAVMSLMGWVAVRQGHAPLHDIVARIRRIRANDLNTRLSPEAVPGELSELAVSFNEMLERVDEAFQRLSDFDADIAHELRTPITNLMTQTEVSLSRERTSEEYRELLYSNLEEYERMAQMIGDMLYLAQSDTGQKRKNVERLNLHNEIQTVFDFYEIWAEERDVGLELAGTATISGDRLMLQRALGNLMSNAIRHTPAGGVVRVALDASKENEVSVVIENPGVTVPPEHIPRLFDRFYRVDPSRRQGAEGARGVGLGLAIVKSIINAHDGEIGVDSVDGRTRFKFTLPNEPLPRMKQSLELHPSSLG